MKSHAWIIIVLPLVLGLSSPSHAQDEIDAFLEESVGDAEKLITAYISPFMKSVSSGMNQGWYNTAKTHKIGGVDLTITVNAMAIPKQELFYEPGKLGLTNVTLNETSPGRSPDYPKAPTMFGPDREPVFRVNDGNSPNFSGPPGIDLKGNIGMNKMPVPMAHLGIGLPKGTDLKIRFVPTINIGDDGEFNMFGIGVMHDIKQWIPGIKMLPFDLSGFVGYTKFKMETRFDEPNAQNPLGVFEMNATTIQGVISKKFSVITFYGGMGYNIAKSRLAVLGSYDFNDDGDFSDSREKNPLDLKFAASGPRATAGFRLKLAVLTLHADYTLQKYSCISAGLGISVR